MTALVLRPGRFPPGDFVAGRNQACPVLVAKVAGRLAVVDGRARLADLAHPTVELRCRSRPGVALSPDYVLDICLGRAYPYHSCLFRSAETGDR